MAISIVVMFLRQQVHFKAPRIVNYLFLFSHIRFQPRDAHFFEIRDLQFSSSGSHDFIGAGIDCILEHSCCIVLGAGIVGSVFHPIVSYLSN